MPFVRSTPRPPPPPRGARPDGDAAERMQHLELIISAQSGVASVPLPPGDRLVIGRDAGCDIVIGDESVSRRHAALHAADPPLLEDEGSTNGTFLSGRQLPPKTPVRFPVGSVAQLGLATIVLQARRLTSSVPI